LKFNEIDRFFAFILVYKIKFGKFSSFNKNQNKLNMSYDSLLLARPAPILNEASFNRDKNSILPSQKQMLNFIPNTELIVFPPKSRLVENQEIMLLSTVNFSYQYESTKLNNLYLDEISNLEENLIDYKYYLVRNPWRREY
jgi:hypothetical protein